MSVVHKEFELLLNRIEIVSSTNSIKDFEVKVSENKWSKKEILGHLIDSAIYNIQRFTEIHYSEKPYFIKSYKQNELVLFNNYQNQNNQHLFHLWLQLNRHVLYLIKNQTVETLKYKIVLTNGTISDLEFLIEDYFEHFYHHSKQINPEWI